MPGREILRWAIFAGAAWSLFLFATDERGLVGPDEPRYASIAREMAESDDWVTPRLNGEPWFEKPALLYWLGAGFMEAGAPADRATRWPVALLSIAFLVFFHWRLRRFFGVTAADLGVLTLGTFAGWVAFSQVGVFDLPLTAAVGAALLLLLEWVEDPSQRRMLPWFGALLGVAVLAKGLVGPAVAALAVLSVVRDRGVLPVARDLIHWQTLVPFLAVCGPWYALCYLRNGDAFVEEFLWRHHVLRLLSPELEHVQPFWYYGPVLLTALLPWTPLLVSLWPRAKLRSLWRDPKVRFLATWAATTLLFFSASTNKLPGYLLPALPPIGALLGVRLSRPPLPRIALTVSAGLLALLPLASAVLPKALADGLPRAWPPDSVNWAGAVPVLAAAVAVSFAARSGRPRLATGLLALAATIGLTQLKLAVFPRLDEAAGTRALWLELEGQADKICLDDVRRHVRYGLEFYADRPLPDCDETLQPIRVSGEPPRIIPSSR